LVGGVADLSSAFALALLGLIDGAAGEEHPSGGIFALRDLLAGADAHEDLSRLRAGTGAEARVGCHRGRPELLGVLKEAGVVDAGGLGVAVILDALRAALRGEEPVVPELDEARPEAGGERLRRTVAHSMQDAWGYCTEFVVGGFSGDEKEFEARIHELGKSVLVIPDEALVKVHLHTQDPGSALTYAGTFGRLSGVKVDDMEAQTRARAEGSDPPASLQNSANLGVVAAIRGAGNRELFESVGAVVVEGGQGANPSTQDFVRAVEGLGASAVILLPNNKHVVPAAERVGELVHGAEVHVVPTTSIAGGLAAMIGYDAVGDPEEIAEGMREIEEGLRYAEVTVAVRDARVEGREVRKGDYMGFLDGKLCAVEASVQAAALALVGAIVEEGADVVTLLRGAELGQRAAEEIVEAIRGLDADLVVEVKNGGQPLYPLQMVAE
jgi:DAK2 domain fusion protein YloV